MRRYLRMLAATFATAILLVAALSRLVDPAGYWDGPIIDGLNFYKPASGRHIEAVKLRQIARVQPTTIVAGNSRVDIGIDPLSPAWPTSAKPVYNLGLPGVSGASVVEAVLRALDLSRPSEIIFAVDFVDFPVDAAIWRAGVPTAPASSATAPNALYEQVEMLLSFNAFIDSVAAIPEQWRSNPSHVTSLGFNPAAEYNDVVAAQGHADLFHDILRRNVALYLDGPKAVAWTGPGRGEQWAAIDRLAAACRRRGIKLTIVTYPYHASLLLAFERTGLWPAFEDWQYRLARFATRTGVPVWSFSQAYGEATEAPEPGGGEEQRLRFYWEAAHFKSALGDRMIDTLYGRRSLGSPLTFATVDARLAAQRYHLADYRRRAPSTVHQIDRLIAEHRRRS